MPPEIARIIQEAVMMGLVATTIVLVAYSPVFRAIGNLALVHWVGWIGNINYFKNIG